MRAEVPRSRAQNTARFPPRPLLSPHAPSIRKSRQGSGLQRPRQHAPEDDGDEEGALQAYAEASRPVPTGPCWYNAGLIHKYRGDWAASLEANARAVRCDPGNEGAVWNLGIAATALGDWATARRAGSATAFLWPEGEGPIDYYAGRTPIRVHGDEAEAR